MTQHHPGGADGSRTVGAAAVPGQARTVPTTPGAGVRDHLEDRTREILERPRGAPGPEQAAQEKAVVHECRYLMRLLATRRRSAGELRERLTRREVPGAVAHEAMARIDRAGLLDDAAFARDWVQQRRVLRELGDEALRRELEAKQVSAELIEAALGAGESDEEQRCRDLVRSRIGEQDRLRLQRERDGAHRRRLSRRLDALLTRKGYPGSVAVQVISSELRRAEQSGR